LTPTAVNPTPLSGPELAAALAHAAHHLATVPRADRSVRALDTADRERHVVPGSRTWLREKHAAATLEYAGMPARERRSPAGLALVGRIEALARELRRWARIEAEDAVRAEEWLGDDAAWDAMAEQAAERERYERGVLPL
jgi:hypothetical protein